MTRSLPSDMISAIAQPKVLPFFAVELLFDSPNELRFWTGIGEFEYDGVTYTGAGELMQISEVQESTDIAAKGATLTMTGIPSELISLALDEDYQGRVCKIKFGMIGEDVLEESWLLKEDGDLLLFEDDGQIDLRYYAPASMFDLFVGYLDQMSIDEGPETATITMAVESKLIDLERPRIRRYTHASQQSRYPSDLAFEFVITLQEAEITWGK